MPLPFTTRSLDPDAAAFCARSGASDRAALSAFVRGVKDLGLWNNMVCWPLRSTQNAGTGTTAFSLGGLGTYNGTLVNGPSWGTDGILFTSGTGNYISTNLDVSGLRQFTTMVATDPATYNLVDTLVSAYPVIGGQYFVFRRAGATILEGIVNSAASVQRRYITGASEDWRVYGWGTQGANTIATESGAQIGVSLGFVPDQTAAAQITIGRQFAGDSASGAYDGVIAWVMFYKDDELTTAQQLSVYNLYKSTLGTGLGLP